MKSFVPQLAMAPHVAALLKLATHAAFVAERQPAPPPASTGAITNWEGGVTYRPAVIVRPQTVDDVVRVVSDHRDVSFAGARRSASCIRRRPAPPMWAAPCST